LRQPARLHGLDNGFCAAWQLELPAPHRIGFTRPHDLQREFYQVSTRLRTVVLHDDVGKSREKSAVYLLTSATIA
jgi:hypothetical protein